MLMDKYIFLDVDGVLNTESTWKTPYQVLDNKVELLAELYQKTKAKIILTSTWRLGYDKEYEKCSKQIQNLIDILRRHNMELYGVTPILKGRTRDVEINRYLYLHHHDNPVKYIILDDDISLFKDTNCLLKVNCKLGLTKENINLAQKKIKS